MPGLEPSGCETPVVQTPRITHFMLQPCCPTAALQTGTALGPDHRSDPALLCGDWELGHLGMPIQAIQGSKAGSEQGPLLLLDGQSFIHFDPLQPRNRLWRWQLAVLPDAVPTLLRKRISILMGQGWGSQTFSRAGRRHSLMLRQILQAEPREALQLSKQYRACKECEHFKALCNVPNNPKHLKIHFSTYCQINLLAGSMFCCKADN